MKPDARVALRFLMTGATLLVLGIAISAIGEAMFGSLLTIVGVALLVSGLHTFGRAGPDTGTKTTDTPKAGAPATGTPP